MIERTVVLIKPDGMQKYIVGEIISRFEKAGLKLVGLKMIMLTEDILKVWYGKSVNCSITNQTGTCTDSDNGMNWYVQGTAIDATGSSSDYCMNSTITEYYC